MSKHLDPIAATIMRTPKYVLAAVCGGIAGFGLALCISVSAKILADDALPLSTYAFYSVVGAVVAVVVWLYRAPWLNEHVPVHAAPSLSSGLLITYYVGSMSDHASDENYCLRLHAAIAKDFPGARVEVKLPQEGDAYPLPDRQWVRRDPLTEEEQSQAIARLIRLADNLDSSNTTREANA